MFQNNKKGIALLAVLVAISYVDKAQNDLKWLFEGEGTNAILEQIFRVIGTLGIMFVSSTVIASTMRKVDFVTRLIVAAVMYGALYSALMPFVLWAGAGTPMNWGVDTFSRSTFWSTAITSLGVMYVGLWAREVMMQPTVKTAEKPAERVLDTARSVTA